MISYDYELIYALGSMLGIADPKGLLKLMEWVKKWGIDAMSVGVVLAWATEPRRETDFEADTDGLKLAWGDYETYMEALKRIVVQDNDLYKALARGLDYTISQYGGADFALSFGGNEMPVIIPGPQPTWACSLGLDTAIWIMPDTATIRRSSRKGCRNRRRWYRS